MVAAQRSGRLEQIYSQVEEIRKKQTNGNVICLREFLCSIRALRRKMFARLAAELRQINLTNI